MSRNGSVELDWADGTYTFCLKIGQLRELQEKLNCGPMTALNRLINNDWRVDDAREVIRLGLIGGGLPPLDALDKVRRYVDERPIIESIPPALTALSAAIFGPPDEQVGKKDQAPVTATETINSSSPSSTAAE